MPINKRACHATRQAIEWSRGSNGRLVREKKTPSPHNPTGPSSVEAPQILHAAGTSSAELPPLCLELIFSFLDRRADVLNAAATCRAWHRASLTAPVWSKIDISWPDISSRSLLAANFVDVENPEPYTPSLEAAFISFLLPRAPLIRWLRIARVGPVRNLDGTTRDGFADTDRLCVFITACINLQHLDMQHDLECYLLPAPKLFSVALLSCRHLTSLHVGVGHLISAGAQQLSQVEKILLSSAWFSRNHLQFEELLPQLLSLKTLHIGPFCGGRFEIRSPSLEVLTIESLKVFVERLQCPSLREYHDESGRPSLREYHDESGGRWDKDVLLRDLPPRLLRVFTMILQDPYPSDLHLIADAAV